MALYAKDVTQSIEPAQANVGTLAKGIEAKAAGAKYAADATSTLLKAAGAIAEQYVAYDVSKSIAGAQQTTEEFLDTNMKAEKAMQDLPTIMAERDKAATAPFSSTDRLPASQADAQRNFGEQKAAIVGTYDQEIQRLRTAAMGGMSNEEYVSRVSALTRKAIAKYPGLADNIRERVASITGLPYADRFAEMQFVKERFSKQQADQNAMTPEKMAIKDIGEVSKVGTFGSQEELFQLYKTNRPEYDSRVKAYNQYMATKTGVDAVTSHINGLHAQSDLEADQIRGSFVAMFNGHLGVNVTSASVSNMENIYKPVLALMAKGENININAAAFDTQLKMYNAQMKTNIEQARVAAITEIDKYISNNPNITSTKRDQMKADINSAADLQLRLFADDKGVGLAAMSAIMSNYRDKSLKEKHDLINLAIQQQAAMQNNSLVMAYWAGGEQRKNLELTNKDFYNFMVKQEQILLSNSQGITNDTSGREALANVTKVIDAAGKSPDAVPVSPDVKTEEIKAAHAAIQSSANTSLDKTVQGSALTPVEKNIISSALSTNVEYGANAQILAKDYKKIGDKIRLLSPEDQATIKDSVSKASRNSVMSITSLREGIENKHGLKLTIGVTPSGQIVAMQTPLTEKELSALRNGVPLPEKRRQAAIKEEAAVLEFNKNSKALTSNLVYSRAMLTEEDPVAVANDYANIINNRQTYQGFFSNKPTTPSFKGGMPGYDEAGNPIISNDFTGAAPIPAGALANQEAMRKAEEATSNVTKQPTTKSSREATGKLEDATSFGNRPDGTPKGTGYLGVLKDAKGNSVTEYSISSEDVKVNGKEIDFPTIVPTLTKKEVDLMLTDIIPNNKRIPDAIYKKAVAHAKKRITEGKSVFADTTPTPATSTTEKWWR